MNIWLVVILSASLVSGQRRAESNFDINKDVVIYHLVAKFDRPIREAVSKHASDVTLILRYTTLLNHAWFDVWATYHDTAIPISSTLPKPPAAQRTMRNLNTAITYASYRVLIGFLPASYQQEIKDIVKSLGMDTELYYEDEESAVGIGNLIGNNVIRQHYTDGMNQLGDACGRLYNRVNYTDCTGYEPVNSANRLNDPSRWQPAIRSAAYGRFVEQRFVTPQYGSSKPYSIQNVDAFSVKPHGRSDNNTYKADVDEVVQASASLTDHQKMLAELFDDKGKGLFSAVANVLFTNGTPTFDHFIPVEFLTNMAVYDVLIVVWKEKLKYDAVRPFSAIRHVYGNTTIQAWGGPGQGTVTDIKAEEWSSYMQEADHPEYPSATQAACSAVAESMRTFTGTDHLNWTVHFQKGSSRIEPGLTPQQDIQATFNTWTDFEVMCGLSRVHAGVHFRDSVENVMDLAHEVGRIAAQFVKDHISP